MHEVSKIGYIFSHFKPMGIRPIYFHVNMSTHGGDLMCSKNPL